MVRAKFKVFYKGSHMNAVWGPDGRAKGEAEVHDIKLGPVTSGSDENKAFYASTPSGTLELNTINKEAADQFMLNGEYYIDFTRADVPVPA